MRDNIKTLLTSYFISICLTLANSLIYQHLIILQILKFVFKLNFLLLLQYCYMLSTESYFLGGELAKHKLRTQPSVIAPAEKNEKNVFFFYIFANGVGER